MMTPAIKRDVAIGLRIKGSETFITALEASHSMDNHSWKHWHVVCSLMLPLICDGGRGASSRLLGSLGMPVLVPGSVLSGRLFDGRVLILSGRFVSLSQLLLSARLIRGGNLNGRTGLKFILTVNDDLLPILQPAINQRQSAVNLCDLHRAHFGRFILGNHVGIRSVRSALYYSRRND